MSSSCSSRGGKTDKGYGTRRQKKTRRQIRPWSYRNPLFHHLSYFPLQHLAHQLLPGSSFAALKSQKVSRKHFSISLHLYRASCAYASLLSRHWNSCQHASSATTSRDNSSLSFLVGLYYRTVRAHTEHNNFLIKCCTWSALFACVIALISLPDICDASSQTRWEGRTRFVDKLLEILILCVWVGVWECECDANTSCSFRLRALGAGRWRDHIF